MRLTRIAGFFCLLSTLAMASTQVAAVPTLQLGIGDGIYNSQTQSIQATSDQFTLYAYAKATGNKAIDVNETHYLSVALTPATGPVAQAFGSFSIGSQTFDMNSSGIAYGTPPYETNIAHDPNDLATHSIFPTFFLELDFMFSNSQRTDIVNTQDSPAHIPGLVTNGDLYFQSFNIDTAGLLPGFALHFDLYNQKFRNNGDVDIDNFAPYSHDADSKPPPVPEPAPLGLLLLGTVLLHVVRRKKSLN